LGVCQLVHGLPIGGAEVLVSRIVRRLDDRFRFVIACLDQIGELGEALADEGIKVVHLERRPGFDWRCVRRLSRLLAEERIGVIHAHQYTPFAYAVATRAFGRRPPVLFTEHGRFYPDYPNFKRKLFNRLLPDKRDRFVAVGESVRQALIHNEGLPPRRVEIVYNGVDLSAFDSGATDRDEVRRELGIAGDTFLVLQVARLDTIKDHATALRAIAGALPRNPAIRLMIVGDGPERESIARAITEQGLGDSVTMLGMRNDVQRLLAAADAFLLTSVSEGIPVTIIEAMAARIPVVSTAVGGVPELIESEVSGLLAPSGDAPRLADALIRLAADRALRERLCHTARQRTETQFSEHQMIDKYAALYDAMLTISRQDASHSSFARA
jgi:sugar transferase (PEP-CTERM/EpsH1 system associated)